VIDLLRIDGNHDLDILPQLLVQRFNLCAPLHVALDCFRWAILVDRRWQGTIVVLYMHQSHINSLNGAQSVFAMGHGGLGVLQVLISSIRPLEVQERPGSLGIAESDLAQTAFDDKLLALGLSFGSLNSTLNLLLHALHVVVTASSLPARTKSAVRLEEVGLRKLVGRLMWVLTRGATNLAEHLIVKVFSNGSLRALLFEIASSGHELLQLDASDEVLVLGCHESVVLRKKCNFVIALSTFGIFLEIGCSFLCRKCHELFGVGNNHARV
jgi:hypothetical protein